MEIPAKILFYWRNKWKYRRKSHFTGETNINTGEKSFLPTKRNLPNALTYKNDAGQGFPPLETLFCCGGIHS
jgi:hypothetical protein